MFLGIWKIVVKGRDWGSLEDGREWVVWKNEEDGTAEWDEESNEDRKIQQEKRMINDTMIALATNTREREETGKSESHSNISDIPVIKSVASVILFALFFFYDLTKKAVVEDLLVEWKWWLCWLWLCWLLLFEFDSCTLKREIVWVEQRVVGEERCEQRFRKARETYINHCIAIDPWDWIRCIRNLKSDIGHTVRADRLLVETFGFADQRKGRKMGDQRVFFFLWGSLPKLFVPTLSRPLKKIDGWDRCISEVLHQKTTQSAYGYLERDRWPWLKSPSWEGGKGDLRLRLERGMRSKRVNEREKNTTDPRSSVILNPTISFPEGGDVWGGFQGEGEGRFQGEGVGNVCLRVDISNCFVTCSTTTFCMFAINSKSSSRRNFRVWALFRQEISSANHFCFQSEISESRDDFTEKFHSFPFHSIPFLCWHPTN